MTDKALLLSNRNVESISIATPNPRWLLGAFLQWIDAY